MAQASTELKTNFAVAWLRLLRPKQWSKNLLVFAALLFTGHLRDTHFLSLALMAFAAMCLTSSGIYIFNDIADADRDRQHPRKQLRPIASGQVQPSFAMVLGTVLLAGGLVIAFTINRSAFLVVIGYLAIQALYNAGLKKTPIADVYCIAIGFVLRAVLGAAALSVMISGWLLFCTGALALMLGFAKRRQEFISQSSTGLQPVSAFDRDLGETGSKPVAHRASRESLAGYSKQALDALVMVFAATSILCYGIYCLESPTAKRFPALVLTALFVAYGISRYLWLVFAQGEGEEPEALLFNDPHILASVILFIATAAAAMSGLQFPVIGG